MNEGNYGGTINLPSLAPPPDGRGVVGVSLAEGREVCSVV